MHKFTTDKSNDMLNYFELNTIRLDPQNQQSNI